MNTKKNSTNDEVVEQHPSYGAITIGRITSSRAHPMYGSSVKHRDTIRLTIHHSECKRMLYGDWYSPKDTIVEVEVTQSQWAEMVSSVGLGAGVPCTIKWLNGRVEEPPYRAKADLFQSEFQMLMDKAMSDAEAAVKKAEELLEKKALNKADRTELLNLMRSACASVKDSAPFVSKQFAEQMERTATEVKGELDAWQLKRMADFAAAGMAQNKEEPLPLEIPKIDTLDKERSE